MIEYSEKNAHGSISITCNTLPAGDLLVDIDGYYKYFPPEYGHGYWPDYLLLSIVQKLQEINKDWDDQIMKALT
jgi:hypothetical protein